VIASTRKPHELKIAEGGIRSYTFKNEVQPILDRACVACHDGSKSDRPNFTDTTHVAITDWSGTRSFAKSYLAFHPYVNRQGPEADMYVMTPYEYHASTSEVVRLLERGHYNVKLTANEWDHINMWIDMNAPGRGEFDADPLNGYNQYARRIELTNKYAGGSGTDWRKELADYASYLKGKGEIRPEIPERPAPAKHKEAKVKGWPLSTDDIRKMLSKEKSLRKEIEVADGVKIAFVRVPAGKFVMGTNNGYSDQAPEFGAEVKNAFWMSEKELTNEQYNALVPNHDSRIYAQHWKDHISPGYPANKPDQPVIRVSYEEALNYCRMLSQKTGLKVKLPTEVQWEWACRGGSNQSFWYGTMDSDFGSYENLADVQLEKMAVTGIDPQPMTKDNPWFPYFNYLPKAETVDDGMMIPTDKYAYKPNPFGLINMHGNLQEWTCSRYADYPYSDKSQATADAGKIVARGGSWIDRPKDATATARRVYLPWQKVNNVGLRLVIED
jgi:formylglycine-generating enzyme required for sulfatase activity